MPLRATSEDATVLRPDPSTSGASGGSGRGGADAPRVLKQRFVLDEKLGSGGMGTVFRAKDLRKVEARDRNPYVAVKVLNNDFREHPEAFIALQREAAKSQALSHRNIVTIYDFDKDGDVPFIIMELLEGQELAELLRTYPTGLPDEIAWPVIRCMCAGLDHAHEAGLVHADFKPGNVYVAPNHTAKILDFGIARAVQVNQVLGDDTVFDPTRLAALTPAYASPQMLDGADAEARDDLFSLGVVIYLMLTGQHPFQRTPANEAARQGLEPERPRRLSRRQWRGLSRCLAFDRESRPASVTELRRYLLEHSPWRSRTALVAAGAVLVTFAIGLLKEDAAVQEARVEVRQVTLMDAQLARLGALVDAPAFDAAWQDKVADEVAILRTLQAAGAPEPPVLGRIRELYRREIGASEDLDRAVSLYRRGLGYGELPQVEEALEMRLADAVVALLDAPALETEWMNALEQAFERLEAAFPGSSRAAALRLETTDVLQAELDASLAAERFPTAHRALEFLETYSFAPDAIDALRARVDVAEQQFLARQAAEARRVATEAFRGELAGALGGSCLELDPAAAASIYRRWTRSQPGLAPPGRAYVGERVSRCVAQLRALDRDRAATLEQRAVALFGPLPGLDAVRSDPCGAQHLIGSGADGGRRGSCADVLASNGHGPRLVVVPGLEGGAPFAITRHEVSWGELGAYCRATGRCEAGAAEDLPATGIGVEIARDYAGWLTAQTGFVYRLPSYAEWRHAAAGAADPNRNCQVRLGALTRGLAPVAVAAGTPSRFGLVNALGNVQEWVMDGGEVKAAGGAFRDPIGECEAATLRAQSGAPDAATGFRLVRELT